MTTSNHNPDVSKNDSGAGVTSSIRSGGHCPEGEVYVLSGKAVNVGSCVFSGSLKTMPDGKKEERTIIRDKNTMAQTSNNVMIRILYRNDFKIEYRLSVSEYRYTRIFRKIRVIPG